MINTVKKWQQQSSVLAAARQAQNTPSPWAIVPIAFLMLIISSGLGMVVFMAPIVITGVITGNISDSTPSVLTAYIQEHGTLPMLFSTVATIAAVSIYLRYVEGRTLLSAGFTRLHTLGRYLAGLGWGVAMLAAAALLAWLMGGLEFTGFNSQQNWYILPIFLGGFMIQGLSEEMLCRGFMLPTLANRAPLWVAIAVNSALFAVLHLFNPGITLLSVVNLLLFGLFASFYFLRTDSIWGVAAMHSSWNFMQGNILGIKVSGNSLPDSIATFGPNAEGSTIINGGAFGLEGSIATTVVLAAGILVLLFWRKTTTQTQQM